MGYPYSSGDVLTAADLNQSSGLVFIKSQTIGTSVASVTVTGAFSSTFENYRIMLSGGVLTAPSDYTITLGNSETGSGYYGSQYYDTYSGTSGTARMVNVATLRIGSCTTFAENAYEIIVFRPFVADRTMFSANGYGNGSSIWTRGTQASSTSFSSFTIGSLSHALTGGTIRVYGYNDG